MADILKATALVPDSFVIDGKRIRPGEQFVSPSTRVTHLLVRVLGFADLTDVPRETPVEVHAQKRVRGKGSYKRRDMRAGK